MDILPKISIITVVKNGERYIEHTIKSIINQTYVNIEYIIIDGQSTDNTVDIIKNYSDQILYWTSEPDSGIYDAMNKGVKASSGDWLLFINSDDFLASGTAIENMIPHLINSDNQIVYGDVIYIYPDGPKIHHGKKWEVIKDHFRNVSMSIAHQATFHSRKLFASRQFDPTFKISGDYDFLLSCLKDHDATYIPIIIAKMRTGGISFTASKFELLKDTRKAQIKNKIYKVFPSFPWIISAAKLIIVDSIIKIFSIKTKDKFKKLLGYSK